MSSESYFELCEDKQIGCFLCAAFVKGKWNVICCSERIVKYSFLKGIYGELPNENERGIRRYRLNTKQVSRMIEISKIEFSKLSWNGSYLPWEVNEALQGIRFNNRDEYDEDAVDCYEK